jgi:thiamine pyrophosphokinase
MSDLQHAGTCTIVIGGDPPDPGVLHHLPRGAFVIAADSGLDHAAALGLAVDLVVGDLDSVSKEALALARRAGVTVEEHPPAKDETDLELALGAAEARGAQRVVVVGGDAGRLDHLLASALGLAPPAARGLAVEAWLGPAWVAAVHGPGQVEMEGRPGELVTLLAVGGRAEGVRTEGLRYPLREEPLLPGSSRGVSNEVLSTSAVVSLSAGTLLVIRPEALAVAP